MLYLVSPQKPLRWLDFPDAMLAVAEEHGADVSGLDWQPATERSFDDNMLRMALRHGTACGDGIAYPAIHTINFDHGEKLRELQRRAQAAHDKLRNGQGKLMESLIPGWEAEGRRLDARIAEANDRSAAEADDYAATLLDEPVKDALRQHWTGLGGRLPAPE